MVVGSTRLCSDTDMSCAQWVYECGGYRNAQKMETKKKPDAIAMGRTVELIDNKNCLATPAGVKLARVCACAWRVMSSKILCLTGLRHLHRFIRQQHFLLAGDIVAPLTLAAVFNDALSQSKSRFCYQN